jgi:hypothetical protein
VADNAAAEIVVRRETLVVLDRSLRFPFSRRSLMVFFRGERGRKFRARGRG